MTDRLSVPELESYLWGAATLLRGLADARDYKQFVFPLLFNKRVLDVWDEEYTAALAETSDETYARATASDHFAIPYITPFAPTVGRAAKLICTTPEFDELAKEAGLSNHKKVWSPQRHDAGYGPSLTA